MNTTECLATTFRNVAQPPQVLRTSLFAPHGAELQPEGEITLLGSPTEIVTRGRSPSHCSRSLLGLEAALKNDLLAIVKTPSPVLYDAADDATKLLKLDGGAMFASDPCWADTSSSMPV